MTKNIQHNLSVSQKPCRIGLLGSGGKKWIAGTIYLHNIIRALHYLPKSEWPRLFLIMQTHGAFDHAHEIKGLGVKVCTFTHREREEQDKQLWWLKESLLAGKWPQTLEPLVKKLNLHAVFPAFKSLGKDFPCPWIGWIPDFQHKRLPQFFSENEINQRDEQFGRIIDEAAHVVVSSRDAYDDLMRWFPTDKNRVSILHFSTIPDESWYDADPKAVSRKFNLPEKFLMFPSQFWAHKNHPALFDCIRILKQKGFKDIALVCTGLQEDYRKPEHFGQLKQFMGQHNLAGNVFLPGLLERLDQIQLMRAAVAIIQPSFFEGWSSLVEDCRTLGKRLYVSDIPSHREQTPPNAQFFDPNNAAQLAELIALDWGNLYPGPDLSREKEARAEMEKRAAVFARSYLNIVERAHQSGYIRYN